MGELGRKEGRERMKENEKELWGVARKLVLLVTEIVSADKKVEEQSSLGQISRGRTTRLQIYERSRLREIKVEVVGTGS